MDTINKEKIYLIATDNTGHIHLFNINKSEKISKTSNNIHLI